MCQGQGLVPLLGAPYETKLHNCHPDAEGLGQSRVHELPQLGPPVSVDFPFINLTLAPCSKKKRKTPPSFSQLDSGSLALCLAVDLKAL